MSKKIIITGGSGFIGNNLIEYLIKDNPKEYDIISIDREPFPKKRISDRRVKIYTQDINNGLPDINNVYAVIHLAARAGVRESDELFEEFVKDNIIATKRVLDKCIDSWKPKLLIFASSSSVYGDCVSKTKEQSPRKPLSPYAFTKVACEKLIETYQNNGKLKDIGCAVLRFFTVYGPNQREGLAIRNFIGNILEDKPITVYGDGTQSRDFLYIDDLCDAIKKIINFPYAINGVYNLSATSPITLNEIIHIISIILDKPITIRYETPNIYDVKKTSADITSFNHLTGWSPRINIREGIRMEIEWAKQRDK